MTHDDSRTRVSVLGPLVVRVGGVVIDIRAGRLRTMVATLALSAGSAVSMERLADATWGPDLPESPRRSLQTYATRLRTLLGPRAVQTAAGGYVLDVAEDDVDVIRFERLLDQAEVPGVTADERRQLLDEALALWHGVPFDGITSDLLVGREAPRLIERFLRAEEQRGQDDLTRGRYGAVIGRLRDLAEAHPLRESLWVLLLTALNRADRRAEALELYERVRNRIADDLGVDPGAQLRAVYSELLGAASGSGGPASDDPRVPRQLPADLPVFAGRADVLERLDAVLDEARRASTAVIATVTGMAGVGKTTLAVHWSHRVADQFPGGQLYLNLRGFDPERAPMEPADALRGLLDALRTPQEWIPSDIELQAALFRTMIAERKVLIVLDNALDAAQVRLLLPGAPGCLALITSRNVLSGLETTAGARPIALGLPDTEEARELLARRVGALRAQAEPQAVGEIVELCDGLPLAIAVVAARATSDDAPLASVVAELREHGGLEAYSSADAQINLRAVFSWSYAHLSPEAARAFRLLGLFPASGATWAAIASLTGIRRERIDSVMAELVSANLVGRVSGRYTLHDLLRFYAAEVARQEDSDDDQRAALRRMLDHFLHTAVAADRLLNADADRADSPIGSGVVVEKFADGLQALAWLTTERRTLVSLIGFAAEHGFDEYASRLAVAITTFLVRRGGWTELMAANRTGLEAALRTGNLGHQAHVHRGLGRASAHLGMFDDAKEHLATSLRLAEQLGDIDSQARAHRVLGVLLEKLDEHEEALSHDEIALELFERAGNEGAKADMLNAVGWGHAQLGHYREGLEFCRRALAIQRRDGGRYAVAATWDSLGYIHRHLGDHVEAVACYERALELVREFGAPLYEAARLAALAEARAAAGDPAGAQKASDEALRILDQFEHPEATKLRVVARRAVKVKSDFGVGS